MNAVENHLTDSRSLGPSIFLKNSPRFQIRIVFLWLWLCLVLLVLVLRDLGKDWRGNGRSRHWCHRGHRCHHRSRRSGHLRSGLRLMKLLSWQLRWGSHDLQAAIQLIQTSPLGLRRVATYELKPGVQKAFPKRSRNFSSFWPKIWTSHWLTHKHHSISTEARSLPCGMSRSFQAHSISWLKGRGGLPGSQYFNTLGHIEH